MLDRDVVAHGALRHHDDTRRLFGTNIFNHGGGRSRKIRFSHDFRRALRMREHDHAGVLFAEQAYLGGSEALMDFAMASPGDDLDAVSAATFCARYSSGSMITRSTPSNSTIFFALPDVQQMSNSAFTAADVLTYVTIGTPG